MKVVSNHELVFFLVGLGALTLACASVDSISGEPSPALLRRCNLVSDAPVSREQALCIARHAGLSRGRCEWEVSLHQATSDAPATWEIRNSTRGQSSCDYKCDRGGEIMQVDQAGGHVSRGGTWFSGCNG
jgi:hypothetical protein